MEDILVIEKNNWRLSVWSKDVNDARNQLAKTLNIRGGEKQHQSIRLDTTDLIKSEPGSLNKKNELVFEDAVFFENKNYEIEFVFTDEIINPAVTHKLNAINDLFRVKANSVRGTVNLGNDIGWFRISVSYQKGVEKFREDIAFEVIPTKMDMSGDLNLINKTIDEIYPLWRFSFAQKTDQELARSRHPHERFPLLWLAQFQSLRKELLSQIRIITNAPHSRLKETVQNTRLDRLKTKTGPAMDERIQNALKAGQFDKVFKTTTRILTLDIPENRFIAMILKHCSRTLLQFSTRARADNGAPENSRISEAFFGEINNWRNEIDRQLAHPLFIDLGPYEGMGRESLVLHQKAGYSGAYRIWQQIKQYLDVFGNHASISVKSIAELYEVWCFLEIRRMLLELGFVEITARKSKLRTRGFEKIMEDDIGAAFEFTRPDNLRVRLAHEPVFSKPDKRKFNQIYSWNAVQKPDIVIEATFPNGELIYWIFDAKYRIESEKNNSPGDRVPEDALNQMHRYRDALIYLSNNGSGEAVRSRPFIGAYVIFPGWYPDNVQIIPESNPYFEAIEAVGIGAFAALPGMQNLWLKDFLTKNLSENTKKSIYNIGTPDEHLVRDSVRIPPTGLELKRTGTLVFVAPAGPVRNETYIKDITSGNAKWYHTRDEAFQRQGFPSRVISDVTHIAIAIPVNDNELSIDFVYEVKKAVLIDRAEITPLQSGTSNASGNGNYWLFELGASQKLKRSGYLDIKEKFQFGMCSLNDLENASRWDQLITRYAYLLNKK